MKNRCADQVKNLNFLSFVLFVLLFLGTSSAFATPGVTTYQAKIVKPNGLPLEASSVNFKFTILDPAGTCILYSETYLSVNMGSTGGLISFSLGSGVKTYPASATTFAEVFSNITPTLACDAGGPGTYSPNANDTRKIVMQFHDGTGWQTLPAMNINAVPYAMYATEAQKLSGLPTCNPGEALSYNGVSFSCETISGSGVTSSTVIAALGYEPVSPASLTGLVSMTSSSVVSALGYTPADGASITAFNASLAAVSSSVGTANSTISSVSSTVNSLSSNLSLVSGTVSSLSGNISAVSSTVSTLSTTVSNVGTSVTALSTSVSNLSASMAALTGSQWVSSGTAISYSTGNVGIGTSNATSRLTVSGGAYLTGPITVGNTPPVPGVWDMGPLLGSMTYSAPFYQQDTFTDFSQQITTAQATSVKLNADSNNSSITAGKFSYVENIPGNFSNYQGIYGDYVVTENNASGSIGEMGSVAALTIQNGPSPVTSQYGVFSRTYTYTGSVANSYGGYFSSINQGGSVTNNYGVMIDAGAGSATNNYGLYIANTGSVTASQTYNIYSAGPNSNNHFAGSVGIGVTLPKARLHLAAGTATTAAFKLTSSTLLTAPTSGSIEYDGFNLYYTDGTNTRKTLATGVGVTSSSVISALGYTPVSAASASPWVASGTSLGYSTGKVGIGTTNPQYNLDVNGTFRVTTSATVYSGSTWGSSAVNSYYSGSDQNGEMWSIGIRPPSYPDGSLAIATHYGSMPITFKINNTEKMRLDTAGNLGIGTATPAATLDVISSVTNSLPATSGTSQTGLLARFGKSTLALDVGTNGSSGAWLQSVNRTDLSTNYPLIFNPNGGPVGVGGYASSVLFSVHQSTGSATDMIRLRDTTDAIDLAFRYNGTNGYEIRSEASGTGDIFFALDGSTGNVGIGTSAPTNMLDVSGSGITATRYETFGTLATFRKAYTATNNESPYLELRHQTVSGGVFDRYGYIQAGQGHDGMLLQGQNAGGYSSLLLNRMGGNVGIGTASPTARLDVSKSANITSETTTYATMVIKDTETHLDIITPSLGNWGSSLNLVETSQTTKTIQNIWSIYREASETGNSSLHFKYGTNKTVDGNASRMAITTTGQVGINVSSPTHALTVSNTAVFNPSSNVSSAIMVGPPTGQSFGGGILMKDYTYYAGMWTNNNGATLNFGAGGSVSGFPSVNTLVVTSAATVGIGTTAPTEKLEVVGNLKVTGEIYGQKSWGFKKGPTAFASDYVNTWASGGGSGSSIDCTSSANGCTILKSGTYEVRCVQRANSTTSTFVGISLNGDRTALESRADAVWNHDHALAVGQFSESNFMGTLAAGNIITCGPATANQTYMIYGAASYNGTLTIKRID